MSARASYGIDGIGTYLPPGREQLAELFTRISVRPGQAGLLGRIHGLKQISAAEKGERLDRFLGRAVESLLERTEIPRPDLILYAHSTLPQVPADYDLLPRLQARFGWEGVTAFGISQLNCTSIMGALQMVEKSMQRARDDYRVLLITGDHTYYLPEARHVKNSTVTGDSASAILLRKGAARLRVLATAVHSDPKFVNGFYEDEETFREFGKVYLDALVGTCNQALEKAGIGWNDLKLMLPHNVNMTTWSRFCKQQGFEVGRLYLDLLPEIGHSYCNDGPLALRNVLDQGRVGEGDRLLWVSVGLGGYYGATVLSC